MKKVLVICKEAFTHPMHYIVSELQNRNYDVEALFVHSSEVLLKDKSYTSFVELNKGLKVHTLVEQCMVFQDNVDRIEDYIDYEYLEMVEDKYCGSIPLSLLQVSSQLFTTPYHYREYFKDLSELEKLYWIQLLFKYFENLVENNDFDMICDLDIAELGRSILHRVCCFNNIKYVTLEFSRYNDILLPTYTLGRKTDKYFIEYYNSIYKEGVEEEYFEKVGEFLSQQKIMAKSFSENNTGKIKSNPFSTDVKRLLLCLYQVVKTIPNRSRFSKVPVVANPWKSLLFFIHWFRRERLLLGENNVFTTPTKGDNYVYFPLHLIPESTTLNKSPFYPNELAVIEAISKSLPVGWKLYVKEHGAMIGERPLSFYAQVNRLSNVDVVRLDFYDDPKPWILNSKGVITLSGTSAYEASMLDRPSIMFGNTFFEVITGIEKVSAFSELPEKIKSFKSYKNTDKKSLAAYIKAVELLGEQVKFLRLLNASEKAILEGGKLAQENIADVKKLVDIFEKDYCL